MTKEELVEAQVEAARRIARERRPRETVRALFVAFAAVTQPLRSGMFTSAIGGLICDAHAPIAFGTPTRTDTASLPAMRA